MADTVGIRYIDEDGRFNHDRYRVDIKENMSNMLDRYVACINTGRDTSASLLREEILLTIDMLYYSARDKWYDAMRITDLIVNIKLAKDYPR